MTSMTRLNRQLERWVRFADKVTPGWRTPKSGVRPPAGLIRAILRHDAERLRLNLLAWLRTQGDLGKLRDGGIHS